VKFRTQPIFITNVSYYFLFFGIDNKNKISFKFLQIIEKHPRYSSLSAMGVRVGQIEQEAQEYTCQVPTF